MRVTEQDTSIERVLAFLDITEDKNPIHRNSEKILPGMFYLALSAPYLNRPLDRLDLSFRNPIQYPCSFDLICEDTSIGRKITASQNETGLYMGRFRFGEQPRNIQDPKLDKFVKILKVKRNHPSLTEILLSCLIPAKLLNLFEGELGMYMKQTIEFRGNCLDNAKIHFPSVHRKPGERGIVKTNYVVGENLVAEGQAFLMPYQEME